MAYTIAAKTVVLSVMCKNGGFVNKPTWTEMIRWLGFLSEPTFQCVVQHFQKSNMNCDTMSR